MNTERSTTSVPNTVNQEQLDLHDINDESLTDIGLARLFARLYSDQMVFAGKRWLMWDGTRWMEDELDEATRRAAAMLDLLLEYVDSLPYKDDTLRRRIVRLKSKKRLSDILALASTHASLRRHPQDLDTDPTLLNFTNGTLDLNSMRLLPHDPRHLITKRIEYAYDPTATAPRWNDFQREVADGDEELVRYKQKAYGMSLLGTLPEQKAFFLLGTGANGKSVELEVLKRILGPYATTVPGDAFLKNGRVDPRNTYARLEGVRLAIASEIDEQQPLAEGAIKSMTGGEELTARRLYQDEYTFHPTSTLFVATNHLPYVAGRDHAIQRRLVVIPFPVTFAADRQDPNLKATLVAEGPGILAWIAEGARLYLCDGLEAPGAVQEATKRFWTHADTVTAFLESRTRPAHDGVVSADELYEAYRKHCTQYGNQALTQTAFGRRMSLAGFNEESGRRRKDGGGNHVYVGIALDALAASRTFHLTS